MRLQKIGIVLLLFWGLLHMRAAPVHAGTTAQLYDIRVSAEAGFDGYYKKTDWFPLRIMIVNEGADLIEGTLEISAPVSFTRVQQEYRQTIDLPAQSEQAHTFYIQSDRYNGEIVVELKDRKGLLIKSITVEKPVELSASSFLYGIVSSDRDEWAYLHQLPNPKEKQPIAFLSLDELPETAVPWQNFNLLIFHDVDTTQLSDKQREALRFWIETGGTLLVTGGRGAEERLAGIADLLPVTLRETRSIPDLPALAIAANVPFRDAGPYVISRSEGKEGTVLLAQDGVPLLVEREINQGLVYFLALDPLLPPLLDWDGNEWLWREIVNKTQENNGRVVGHNLSYTDKILYGDQKINLPSVYRLGCFLFLYLFLLGPVNYWIIKRFNNPHLIWYTIPLKTLLFSVIALSVGFQNRGEEVVIHQFSMQQGHIENSQLIERTVVGIYSHKKDEYEIQLPNDQFIQLISPEITVVSGRAREAPALMMGQQTVQESVTIFSGDTFGFMMMGVNSTPLITGTVLFDLNKDVPEITVYLENKDTKSFYDGAILAGNFFLPLGRLEPQSIFSATYIYERDNPSLAGGAMIHSLDEDELRRLVLKTAINQEDSQYYRKYHLLRSIENYYYTDDYLANHAVMILWSEQQPLSLEIDIDQFSYEGGTLNLLEMALIVRANEPKGIELPAALITESRSGRYDRYAKQLRLCTNQYVEIEYRLAVDIEVDLNDLTILMEPEEESAEYLLELTLWNWEEESWDSFAGQFSGWGTIEVEDDSLFINERNRVRLKVSNLNGACLSIEQLLIKLSKKD